MEVLEEMKADGDLKRRPEVILTTTEDEEDVFKRYSLHANCFVTKPTGLTQFNEVIKTMEKILVDDSKTTKLKVCEDQS
jgi:DNA-binding NarL/FixJ family response regulator